MFSGDLRISRGIETGKYVQPLDFLYRIFLRNLFVFSKYRRNSGQLYNSH